MLEVDTEAMTVDLEEEWLPWNKTVSTLQGNHQILENANPIIGWGHQSCFQEYDSNVDPLWAARFGVGDVQSSRAYGFEWIGRPRTPHPIAVAGQRDNDTVYASWNGATEAKQWRLLVSTFDAPPRPTFLWTAANDDFKTSITYTRGQYDYFQVFALDSREETLAFSDCKNLDGDTI